MMPEPMTVASSSARAEELGADALAELNTVPRSGLLAGDVGLRLADVVELPLQRD